jgi:hypothetical protein
VIRVPGVLGRAAAGRGRLERGAEQPECAHAVPVLVASEVDEGRAAVLVQNLVESGFSYFNI